MPWAIVADAPAGTSSFGAKSFGANSLAVNSLGAEKSAPTAAPGELGGTGGAAGAE